MNGEEKVQNSFYGGKVTLEGLELHCNGLKNIDMTKKEDSNYRYYKK